MAAVLAAVLGALLVGAVLFAARRRGAGGSDGTLTPEERLRGLAAGQQARAIHHQTHNQRL